MSRRPVLRSLRCWIRAPGPRSSLRGAAPEPLRAAPGTAQPPPHGASSSARAPRAAPGAAQPPPRSRRPSPFSCSGSRRVPPCALQPLGSSAHSPGAQVLLVSPGARGHPRPPGSCSNSPRAPFRPGRSVQLLLLRDGALLSWGHSPRPQPGSSWAPPPWRPLFLYVFFPVFLP